MGNWGAPPEPIPMGQNMPSASPAGAPKTPEPPSRDGGGVQKKREMYDARIGKYMYLQTEYSQVTH